MISVRRWTSRAASLITALWIRSPRDAVPRLRQSRSSVFWGRPLAQLVADPREQHGLGGLDSEEHLADELQDRHGKVGRKYPRKIFKLYSRLKGGFAIIHARFPSFAFLLCSRIVSDFKRGGNRLFRGSSVTNADIPSRPGFICPRGRWVPGRTAGVRSGNADRARSRATVEECQRYAFEQSSARDERGRRGPE